jgi:hypothetical protein
MCHLWQNAQEFDSRARGWQRQAAFPADAKMSGSDQHETPHGKQAILPLFAVACRVQRVRAGEHRPTVNNDKLLSSARTMP